MKLEAVDHGLELNRRERMNRGNGTISELANACHQVSSHRLQAVKRVPYESIWPHHGRS